MAIKEIKVVKKKGSDQPAASQACGNIVYADSVMQLGAGGYVSRILLGVEHEPGDVHPELQLVLPTNVLVNFAISVLQAFSQEDLGGKMKRGYVGFSKQLDELRALNDSGTFKSN